ncbi:DNA primase [Mycobacterium phage Scorpia]|uniref:DNA primase n=1 Tax=Mycobacterium phage Scorpia TaxID=2517968 RepID=A0A482J510_9CAUD|nr:DNA primase [Mycobacterium phage Scorpia]QBP29087.1 DNA primase [Mycobacterium phage Scorpia]
MSDAAIVRLIKRYYPDWEPPKVSASRWQSCLCPFHGDEQPSASISVQYNAFNCFVCGVKGDLIKLIREREGVTFAEAKRIAEELSEGSDGQVQAQPPRQSRRRVFGDARPSDFLSGSSSRNRQVHARVRGRPTPWS